MIRTKLKTRTKLPFKPRGLEGKEVVFDPAPGTVVEHIGWSPAGPMEGYPCDVYIIDGHREINGHISNWWTWKRIIVKKGETSLGPKESGYGAFRVCENKYDIKTLVRKRV